MLIRISEPGFVKIFFPARVSEVGKQMTALSGLINRRGRRELRENHKQILGWERRNGASEAESLRV